MLSVTAVLALDARVVLLGLPSAILRRPRSSEQQRERDDVRRGSSGEAQDAGSAEVGTDAYTRPLARSFHGHPWILCSFATTFLPRGIATNSAQHTGGAATCMHGGLPRPPPTPAQLTRRITQSDVDGLAQLVREHGQALNHIHICAAMVQLARVGARGSELVEQLLLLARGQLPRFQARELASMAWALAKLGHQDMAFMGSLLEEAMAKGSCQGQRQPRAKLSGFTAQGLANMAWALATLGHQDTPFIRALLAEARAKLHDFSAQELANLAWALATLQHEDRPFMGALLSRAKGELRSFNEQNLASMLWALATLGYPAGGAFVKALLVEAEGKLPSFSAQALANTAWALAKLEHYDAQFMQLLLSEVRRKLHDFTSQGLGNTAWALATLRHHDEEAALAIAQHARQHELRPLEVGQLTQALATLGVTDPAMFVFGSQLLGSSSAGPSMNDKAWAVSNTLHGHAMAAVFQPWALTLLLQQAELISSSSSSSSSSSNVHDQEHEQYLRQLHVYMLMLEARGCAGEAERSGHSYRRLREHCAGAWLATSVRLSTSQAQLQVLKEVRQLPQCHGATSEQRTQDGLLSVDIALQLPGGERVAVEVDGPQHFMANKPGMPTGQTLLRNRQLKERGWRVVSVPVTGWQEVAAKGPEACRDYLVRLIFGQAKRR